MTGNAKSFAEIPLVDMARWREGDAVARAAFAGEVREICHHIGFMILTRSGVEQGLVDGVAERCRRVVGQVHRVGTLALIAHVTDGRHRADVVVPALGSPGGDGHVVHGAAEGEVDTHIPFEIIEDVDVDAFRARCREYFSEGFAFSELYNRITADPSKEDAP